ncbi:MAG: hypothetical protein ACXVYM_09630 [Gaiellaceae bacterium]
MIEPPRKHGPFDLRYPSRPTLAPPVWELQAGEEEEERLDWSSFLERFFPNRRRHDFEALGWYVAYTKRLEQGSPDERSGTPRRPPARRSADSPAAGAGMRRQHSGPATVRAHVRVAATPSALLALESEGGTTAKHDVG